MAYRLIALAAFPGDLGSLPSTYMVAHKPSVISIPRSLMSSFGIYRHYTNILHMHTCGKTH